MAQGFNAGNLSTGIIGRTVDTVLVPYIVNVRAEGFTFDFQRWGRRDRVSPADVAALQRKVEAYEQANKHGLRPRLRTTINISQLPSVGVNPRIVQATTVANAESQLAELDALEVSSASRSARE